MRNKNALSGSGRCVSALSSQDVRNLLAAAERAELRGFEMSAQTTAAQMKVLAEHGMKTSMASPKLIEKMQEIGEVMIEDWRKTASPEAQEVLDRDRKSVV